MATRVFHNVATYHVTDPIENLSVCVTLRKRGTQGERRLQDADNDQPTTTRGRRRGAAAATAASAESSTATRDATADAASDDDANGSDPDEQGKQGLRIEQEEADQLVCPPRVFRWQEKAFGPMEVTSIRQQEASGDDPSGWRTSLLRAGGSAARKLSNHHREVFARLEAEARERGDEYNGEVIYSRVNSECAPIHPPPPLPMTATLPHILHRLSR